MVRAHSPIVILAALLILATTACAKESPMPPAAPPTSVSPVDADLLVEVRSYSHFAGGSGYRVRADGAYDVYRSDRPGEPEWKSGQALSAEGLAAVRAALARIQPGSLDPRYGPEKGPTDRGNTGWRLRVGDTLVSVEVVPGTSVPALEAVEAAIAVAVVAEFSMEWIVGDGDGAARHPIRPDADTAPVDAVVNALIASGTEVTPCEPGAGATRVATVLWKSPAAADERQELWSDGLELWHGADGSTSCKRHPGETVVSIQALLAGIDWSALTSR
jgi:hypothetical protein